MRIGLSQISCVTDDPKSNVKKIIAYARQAAESGCQVVIFPEMSDTGYLLSTVPNIADSDGRALAAIASVAASANIWIVAGLSEKSEGLIYNSVAVIAPTGNVVTRYRKTHLFRPAPIEEDKVFSRGTHMTQCEIAGTLWGFSICYDLRFPELYRGYAIGGCKVLTNCTAWPLMRAAHWETLIRARAIENQCYFLGANRVGKDGGFEFCGRSSIVSPYGEIVALGSENREELVIGEIDFSQVDAYRSAIPVLEDRRPDIYREAGITLRGT
jgi:omega-amidase